MNIKRLFRRKQKDPHCSVVIVAAGSSERMGSDKLLMTLGAKPVLIRTLLAFEKCPQVDDIVVVTKQEKIMCFADMIKLYDITKVTQVISGGATRMESALAGVSAVRKGAKLIAIHDGARPLVTAELIERVVNAANEYVSAVPAVRSVDTLKQVDEDGVIINSVDRDTVVRVQTPQVFDADIIKGALTKAVENRLPLTDDCSAMEMMGVKTHVVEGDSENIKLTEPGDIVLAEAILKKQGVNAVRIGHGYDVHRLTEGRRLILGGVDIPYEKGLLGHSDADVLTHALMDALLGAAALGDIGKLFPDNDDRFLGADSVELLREVCRVLAEKGYCVCNVDCTILAQRPKLAPHIQSMREIISAAMGLELDCVSIKATTEEGLGFTGEGLGIAAHAVALIEKTK